MDSDNQKYQTDDDIELAQSYKNAGGAINDKQTGSNNSNGNSYQVKSNANNEDEGEEQQRSSSNLQRIQPSSINENLVPEEAVISALDTRGRSGAEVVVVGSPSSPYVAEDPSATGPAIYIAGNNHTMLAICRLFLISNTCTLVLSVVPVLYSNPPSLFQAPDYSRFYTVSDLIRLLEPIIMLPLQLQILVRMIFLSKLLFLDDSWLGGRSGPVDATISASNTFKGIGGSSGGGEDNSKVAVTVGDSNRGARGGGGGGGFRTNLKLGNTSILFITSYKQQRRWQLDAILTCLGISLAVYQQGAGFHSAANMFKNALVQVMSLRSTQIQGDSSGLLNSSLLDLKSYMRDLWEHTISHYMYAAGGIGVSFVYAYLMKNVRGDLVKEDGKNRRNLKGKVLTWHWSLNAVLYGLTIGLLSIQFPYGSVVSLVLIIIYGYGILFRQILLPEALERIDQAGNQLDNNEQFILDSPKLVIPDNEAQITSPTMLSPRSNNNGSHHHNLTRINNALHSSTASNLVLEAGKSTQNRASPSNNGTSYFHRFFGATVGSFLHLHASFLLPNLFPPEQLRSRLIIIEYYVVSYTIGLIIVIIWLIYAGPEGFKNREAVNSGT